MPKLLYCDQCREETFCIRFDKSYYCCHTCQHQINPKEIEESEKFKEYLDGLELRLNNLIERAGQVIAFA